MKRLTITLLAALIGFAALPPAQAQDRKPVHIELRDGKAYVNGKLIEAEGRDRVSVETEGGNPVTVHFAEDGRAVWAGNAEESERHGSYAFSFGDNEFKFDGDMPARLRELMVHRDGPGSTFFFDGDALDSDMALLRERGPQFFGSRLADPKTLAMEREIQQKVRELRRADGADEKARLETELDALLEDAFEAKLQVQREEAERLEERLAELREKLDDRAEARREIIARRKSELLGRRDVLDW